MAYASIPSLHLIIKILLPRTIPSTCFHTREYSMLDPLPKDPIQVGDLIDRFELTTNRNHLFFSFFSFYLAEYQDLTGGETPSHCASRHTRPLTNSYYWTLVRWVGGRYVFSPLSKQEGRFQWTANKISDMHPSMHLPYFHLPHPPSLIFKQSHHLPPFCHLAQPHH